MTDKKLSELPAGSAIANADLFYSAQSLGGGSFTQVQQSASALRIYVASGFAQPQRSVTSSPIVVVATDQILNVNISSGSPTCTLPQASTRAGVPLTFKDIGGQCFAHNLTLTPFAGDTIDGMASYVIADNYAGVTLVPITAGGTGWFIG